MQPGPQAQEWPALPALTGGAVRYGSAMCTRSVANAPDAPPVGLAGPLPRLGSRW